MVNATEIRSRAAEVYSQATTVLGLEAKTAEERSANTAKARVLKAEADSYLEQAKEIEELEARNKQAAKQIPHVEVRDNKIDMPWGSNGEFLIAVRNACTERGSDPRLDKRAASGLNTSIDADGGYLVGTDFSNTIISKSYETGSILARVRKVTISGNSNSIELPFNDETSRVEGSRFGGVQVYMANEADTVTAKKPKFGKHRLQLNKIMALGYATDEMIEDAALLETFMLDAFRKEIAFKVEDLIMNGTGAGQPLGVLNAANAALVPVAIESGPQTADTVVYANIVKMRARLWAKSRANAVWCLNQDVEPQLHLMTSAATSAAQPVYLPLGGAAALPYDTLMGRPVIPTEYNPTLGDQNDITFIDFNEYILATKGTVQEAASMHVRFLNDEMAYRLTFRLDGQPIWKSALTPAKGSNTLSPYVTLATR